MSSPTTAYLAQGDYGHAVAHRLAGPDDVLLDVRDEVFGAALPYADRLVLICDADRDDLRAALDAESFTRGIPSIGLELSPTQLRCGPLVIPGATPCHGCSTRRRRQHGYRPLPEGLAPLEQGYAEHHVVIGVGLISMALGLLDEGGAAHEEAGGRVWTVELVTGLTSSARVTAVDRCPTCSGRYDGARDGLSELAVLLPARLRATVSNPSRTVI